ncbi:hypothetical protein H1C71_027054 [Ictidomys tridecemlineatus]|nr:hypothetical protein H1C71_027054 [Ictidomys tridecemlineatus]
MECRHDHSCSSHFATTRQWRTRSYTPRTREEKDENRLGSRHEAEGSTLPWTAHFQVCFMQEPSSMSWGRAGPLLPRSSAGDPVTSSSRPSGRSGPNQAPEPGLQPLQDKKRGSGKEFCSL